MDRKFLEDNGVDVKTGLELLGDMDMYNDTMSDFVDELESKNKDLISFKDKKDMNNYSILIHSIKSDCKYLGFTHLAELAYEHELKSKDNDLDFVVNNFDILESEIEKVLNIAKKYLGKE